MEQQYDIYFAGQVLPGEDLASVRERVARLFKADEATLDKLFSGTAQRLKQACDKATAIKYKQAMAQAGAQAIIRASGQPANATSPASTPPAASAAKPLSAAERIAALAAAPDAGGFADTERSQDEPKATAAEPPAATGEIQLTPAGTSVLSEAERTPEPVAEIDITAITLMEGEPSSPPPATGTAPAVDHLSMADVGETIPTLPDATPALNPNTDAIELTPPGTDLRDCNPVTAKAPDMDLSSLDMAPVGTDMLDKSHRETSNAPTIDTGHLELKDP